MYLEEQKILLCGIDHGFSTMKTAHFVFENGVKELGGEASLLTNTMFLNGRYFKVGEGRLPLKDTKVEDEDYFLLTLAAMAREMDYYGLSDTEVYIAAGLPFTRFGQEKAEFKEYLNPGNMDFQYNGKEYHIICRDVFLYPQCYAAIADRLGKLSAELLIVDIGSKTVDIIHTRKHVPVESDCITIPSALIQCMANINNVVYRKTNRTLTEEQIQQVMMYGNLKFRLQRVDEELCKIQKEMYRDRASQKRACKTSEDLIFFEAFEEDYRERLEQIKLQKKDNYKKLKAVERCLERDGSMLDAELEYRIPVDDMVDLADVEKDAVPGNPYRVKEDVMAAELITKPIVEVIAEAVTENEIVAEVEADVETATVDVSTEPEIVTVDDEIIGEADIDEAESVAPDPENDEVQKTDGTMRLPSDRAEYMRMNVAEKVRCYPFDDKGTDAAFEMVRAYFEKIGMDTSFHSVYEESKLLTDYYEKQKVEEFIGERAERVIETMKLLEINSGRIAEYSADVLSEVFGFGDMEYFAGMKLFNKVIDRLGVGMDQQRRYEVFDRIYEEGMREKKLERGRNSR